VWKKLRGEQEPENNQTDVPSWHQLSKLVGIFSKFISILILGAANRFDKSL
jgi:hypothetical protein